MESYRICVSTDRQPTSTYPQVHPHDISTKAIELCSGEAPSSSGGMKAKENVI